jgi:F0F1-type ATP synthase assembly protein I
VTYVSKGGGFTVAYKRKSSLYAGMALIVMALGLYSRKKANLIPDFLDTYLGDSLWALMIFFILGFVFRSMQTRKIALMGLSFCYLIELSQLYKADWIDKIRETTLGGLILGYGFLWSDLAAYVVGIGMGVIIEHIFLVIRRGKEQSS